MRPSSSPPLSPDVVPHHVGALIHGQRIDDGEAVPIIDPATAEVVSHFIEADAALVDRAVQAARTAFDVGPWPRMAVAARQRILRDISATLMRHADELALLECANTGIVMREIRQRHLPRAAANF